MNGDDLKHCGHGCGLVKHQDEFSNDKSRADGKDIYCKECRARTGGGIVNQCARCQQDVGDHGYIMFFRHPTQGRFMAQICVICHDEMRAGQPVKKPRPERTAIPAAFYKAFDNDVSPGASQV